LAGDDLVCMEDKGKQFLAGLEQALKDNEDMLLSLLPGYVAACGFETEEEAGQALSGIRQLMVGWFTVGYVAGMKAGAGAKSDQS